MACSSRILLYSELVFLAASATATQFRCRMHMMSRHSAIASWPQSRCSSAVMNIPENEFARSVKITGIKKQATRFEITASPEECSALASRFELEQIGRFDANISLALVYHRNTRIRAFGKLTAQDVVRKDPKGGTRTLQVDYIFNYPAAMHIIFDACPTAFHLIGEGPLI